MPKVRFGDYLQYPEQFEDIPDDYFDSTSSHHTQPFFRDKKHRKKDRRLRDKRSRHNDDEDL